MSLESELLRRIESRSAVIGIVGLGYVGLPVALAFLEAGFRVLGIESSQERAAALEGRHSYLADVSNERLSAAHDTGRFEIGTAYGPLAECDVVIVAVPTPLRDGIPDLSMVVAAVRAIGEVLRKGSLVVLESTSYPGTTEDLVKPLIEESGNRAGIDFFLVYSPERIDPGNSNYGFTDIPKVVGGIDEPSARLATALYERLVPKVVTVQGPKEAELSKLIENTFRHVNIALVNELAVYAHDMGVNIWEAIDAASTKPFGFLPFWPGPGWGGHCIPLDPAYLSWRVRQDRAHEVRFVELAQTVNAEMPRYVAERASLLLNEKALSVKGAKILGLGVAYKAGTEDTRGSPGIKVLSLLSKRGANVSFHDPLVTEVTIEGRSLASVTPLDEEALKEADLVIAFVPQIGIDWKLVGKAAATVFDCCNALSPKLESVVKL